MASVSIKGTDDKTSQIPDLYTQLYMHVHVHVQQI